MAMKERRKITMKEKTAAAGTAKNREFIRYCVDMYKVIIDASAILADGSEKMLLSALEAMTDQRKEDDVRQEKVSPEQEDRDSRLVIFREDMNRLEAIGSSSEETADPVLREKAGRMYQLIRLLGEEGLADIVPSGETELESQAAVYIKRQRLMHQNLLLVTQRQDCRPDRIKGRTTLKAYVGVCHVEPDGTLAPTERTEVSGSDRLLSSGTDLHEGSTVYSGEMAFILKEMIGEGGEGKVYTFESDQMSGDDYVIKIYRPEKLTASRRKKVELLARMPHDRKGICLPVHVVTDEAGCFRGYLMQRAKGTELSEIFSDPIGFIPQEWKKFDMVRLTIRILENIVFLHDNQILVGDINPHNILVENPRRVWFVDCDSYQAGGIPCGVGHDEYTAPEIMGKDFSGFLRTEQNEAFAVATLVFQMMVVGMLPYSHKGGGDNVDNILGGDFVYPFMGRSSNGRMPDGPAKYEWSNLAFYLKEAFFETFSQGGRHNRYGERLHAEDWLDLMHRYPGWLKIKRMGDSRSETDVIFPAGSKVVEDGGDYAACRCCGRLFYKRQLTEGFCRQCLDEGEEYQCQEPGCHEILVYTNLEKYVWKKPRDRFCSIHAAIPKETRTCRCCGREFTLTKGQYYGFLDRKLKLPKTCPACRKAGKNSSAA